MKIILCGMMSIIANILGNCVMSSDLTIDHGIDQLLISIHTYLQASFLQY